jgi:SAM-dependent methyltransferase
MNGVLKTRREWAKAVEQVKTLRLFPHPEPSKNWDSLAALACILRSTKQTANILDAGAELYSVILPWLFLYGYKNLVGVNLVYSTETRRGPIRYEYADIMQTSYKENSFNAVTCLSVIEHGVDLRLFFKEMSRILKVNGILITSTDYFEPPVDTKGQKAYRSPIHIFSKDEIIHTLEIAREFDLELTSPIDLNCDERTVHWEKFDLEYTFITFALRKVDQPGLHPHLEAG